jgi:hypothetical protein
MKKYLMLIPDAADARAAQDKIYEWEGSQKPGKGVQKYLLKISQGMLAKADKMSMDVNYEISVKSMMIEIFTP